MPIRPPSSAPDSPESFDITPVPPAELLARPLPSPTAYHRQFTAAVAITILGGALVRLLTAPSTLSPLAVISGALLPPALCALATMLSSPLWQAIGRRGRLLDLSRALPLALILGALLPPSPYITPTQAAIIALSAGFLLSGTLWLSSVRPFAFIHPVALAALLLVVLLPNEIHPRSLNAAGHALLNYTSPASNLHNPPPAAQQSSPSQQQFLSPQLLLREQLPPLEQFIVGGQPRPVALASQVAILAAALFLLWVKHRTWQPLLAAILAAAATFAIAPIPVVVIDHQPQYQWLLATAAGIDAATVITLAAYQLFAGTLLYTAVFITTDALHRPFSRRGQLLHAALFGSLAMLGQLYLCPFAGPLAAAALIGFLSIPIDRLFPPKTLF